MIWLTLLNQNAYNGVTSKTLVGRRWIAKKKISVKCPKSRLTVGYKECKQLQKGGGLVTRTEKLNSLIEAAKAGCNESRWMLIAYFAPYVEQKVEEIWRDVEDYGAFINECDRQISKGIFEYDRHKCSPEKFFKDKIDREAGWFRKRWLKKRRGYTITPISSLRTRDDDGEEREFEVSNALSGVDDDLEKWYLEKESIREIKKKIAPLARGDEKKLETVLNGWLVGMTDSEIARVLAHQTGKPAESNRKFIQRFKNRCRRALMA